MKPVDKEQVDEAFGQYLKYLGARIGGIFSDRLEGKADLLKASTKVLKMFNKAMGMRDQKYKNVTWKTLIEFLSNPQLLGLNKNQVLQIVNDPKIKQEVFNAWKQRSKGLPAPMKTWGQSDEAIGGPAGNFAAGVFAEMAVTAVIQLAAINYLEGKTSAEQTAKDRYGTFTDKDVERLEKLGFSDRQIRKLASRGYEHDDFADIYNDYKKSRSPWDIEAPVKGKSQIPKSPQIDLKSIQSKIQSLPKDKLEKIRKIIVDKLGAAS